MNGPIAIEPGAEPGTWDFLVTAAVLTPAAAVQGGVIMAALVEAIERTTARPVVWATARYLRHVGPDARVALSVASDLTGHATTQASATASVAGIVVAQAWATTGHRDFPLEAAFVATPNDLAAPAAAALLAISGVPSMAEAFAPRVALGRLPARSEAETSPSAVSISRQAGIANHDEHRNEHPADHGNDHDIANHDEHRNEAGSEHADGNLDGLIPGTGRTALWLRLPGGPRMIAASDLAVLADFSVLATSEAVGMRCTGNSLDNTLRVVARRTTTDVLLDVSVVAVSGGFGHLESRLWSDGGELLSVASTTLVLRPAGPDGRSTRARRHIVGDA